MQMNIPGAVHHAQRCQVSTGQPQEGPTCPVSVIPVDEGRPEALEAAGLVVAEEEERKKEETKKNWNE